MIGGIQTAISNIGAQLPDVGVPGSSSSQQGFTNVLTEVMGRVEGLEQSAQQTVANSVAGDGAGVGAGGSADVHEAVIAVEKAELSFELVVQVRNKVVEAYQEVSRMQF